MNDCNVNISFKFLPKQQSTKKDLYLEKIEVFLEMLILLIWLFEWNITALCTKKVYRTTTFVFVFNFLLD